MSKFNIYSVDSYVLAGLSEKEAKIKVEQNKLNTSRGIRLSLLSQTLNRLKIKNNCYSLEQLLYIVDEFVNTYPHISSTKFWKIIKKIQIYQNGDIDKCIEHLKEGMGLFANYKTQFRSSDFLKFLYGKESIEYKNKLLHNKSYASCSKEKFLEKYEDKAEGLRQFKIKYASNSLEHLIAKHNITEDEAREIINSRIQKGNNTFNLKSDEEKARINKSKGQSLETLISKFGPNRQRVRDLRGREE